MKNHIRNSFVWSYLISYLIVLVISIALSGISYSHVLSILEEEIQHSNLLILQQSSRIIDGRLKELDNTFKALALNRDVSVFLYAKNPIENPREVIKIMNAKESISPYGYSNGFVKTILIHSRNANSIISPYHIDLRPESSYGHTIEYKGMSYRDWSDQMLKQDYKMAVFPKQDVRIDGENVKVITLIQSLPYNVLNYKGNVLFLIKEATLQKLLGNREKDQAGYTYIEDTEGHILTSVAADGISVEVIELNENKMDGYFDVQIGDRDMMVSFTTSSLNGWRYVNVLPKEVVINKVDNVQNYIMIVILIIITLGFIISALLAYKNGKPIGDIAMSMSSFIADGTAFNYQKTVGLQGSINYLIGNNQELKERFLAQKSFITRMFFENLLNNRFNNERELEQRLIEAGIQYSGGIIRLLILELDSGETNLSMQGYEGAKMLIHDLAQQMSNEILYILDQNSETLVFFIQCDADEERYKEKMTQIFHDIKRRMSLDYDILFNVAGSKRESALSECHRAYEEVQFVMDYFRAQSSDSIIIWYDQVVEKRIGSYYPVRIQEQLINLSKTGNSIKVQSILEEVLRINLAQHQLGKSSLRQLGYSMSGTILELAEAVSYENPRIESELKTLFQQLEHHDTFGHGFDKIRALFILICETVETAKERQKNDFQIRVMAYIGENYADHQISLDNISEKFERSRTTVENIVKEQVGMTLAQYVEHIRINESCRYLREGMSISDIANKVGYSNAQVFRRAFKRVKGVNPSSYGE